MSRAPLRAFAIVALGAAFGSSAPATATGPYRQERADLARAIRAVFVERNGGVRSWVRHGAQEDPSIAGTGHDRTSESTGLLLAYAARAGERALFATAHRYYRSPMRARNGLAHWKLDRADRPAANDDGSYSSAPIDELRIARALRAGATAFGSGAFREDARAIARVLRSGLRGGLMTDDVSWGPWAPAPGERAFPAYLDVAAMRLLAADDAAWSAAARGSLPVLRGAVAAAGPPRTVYDPRADRYGCERGWCDTIPGVWIGLRLLDAGDRASARRVWSSYAAKVKAGRLAGAYTPAGRASPYEDLASYALLARLAWRLGERDAATAIVRAHIAPRRIAAGPLLGLYSWARDDAPAFDNLQILITLEELAGRRAIAD